MDENNIFMEAQAESNGEISESNAEKKMDVTSLVLGIVSIVAAAFIPLISYICGIIGIVFAIKNRKEKRTTLALILCIVGIIGGVVSNVIAAKMLMEQMGLS